MKKKLNIRTYDLPAIVRGVMPTVIGHRYMELLAQMVTQTLGAEDRAAVTKKGILDEITKQNKQNWEVMKLAYWQPDTGR